MWGAPGTLPKEFTPKTGDDYGCQPHLKKRQPIFLNNSVNDLKGSTHSMPMAWFLVPPARQSRDLKLSLHMGGRTESDLLKVNRIHEVARI